jgi:hypothetical protein
MKEFNQSTKKISVAFPKKIIIQMIRPVRAKVEGIEVEIKVEVEVEIGKVEGKWRTKDCY